MKDYMILLLPIAIIGMVYFISQSTTGSSEPTINRESYQRLAVKSCVNEATKYDGVRYNQALEYCQCVMDEVYEGKTIEQMRQMDAEVIGGHLPDKYDAIILRCVEQVM